MSVTGNVVNFFVAVAMAHDVSNPIGSYSSGSYVDSCTGQYWGEEIFRHPKTVASLAKYGAIEYARVPDQGEIIRFEDRREVLSEFARGYADAEDGQCTEEGAIESVVPQCLPFRSAVLPQAQQAGRHGLQAQGRVCHGVVCVDTGEKWTQD